MIIKIKQEFKVKNKKFTIKPIDFMVFLKFSKFLITV